MNLEAFAKKLGPWVPLLIAAGYFVFLIMSWNLEVSQVNIRNKKFDEWLDKHSTAPEPEKE